MGSRMAFGWSRSGRRVGRRAVARGLATGAAMGAVSAWLAACGGAREPQAQQEAQGDQRAVNVNSATPPPAAERKRGGSVRMYAPSGDLQRLDFQQTISTPTQNVHGMVFNRLMSFDPYTPPGSYTIQPDLAESWEITPERVTFKLRKDVKWQNLPPMNGRGLTAKDVKYSLDRARTQGADWVWSYKLEGVGRIDAPDDYTVVLNMDQPSAVLQTDLAHGPGMGIVPPEVIEQDGNLDKRWVGTGAFIMEKWEKGNSISFRRNPDYFKAGLPYVDDVRVVVIADAAARLANFLSGQVMYHELAGDAEINQIKSSLKTEVQTYYRLSAPHKVYGAGPTGPKYMQDLRVRQAIDAAIDRAAILDIAFGGRGLIGGPVIPLKFGEWSLPETTVKETYKSDPTQAKQLLQAAGISTLEIPLEFSNTSRTSADELPLIKQQLAKIGIEAKLVPQERTIYLQRQVDNQFELMAIDSGVGPDPDSLLFPYFHTNGGKNWARVSDPELDRRIEKARTTLNHQERLKLVQDITKDWKKYLFRTHTYYPEDNIAWNPSIVGSFIPKGADWTPMEGVSFA